MIEKEEGSHWPSEVGGVLEEARPGYARLSLEIERRHANYDGGAHGGVIASLIDSAVGLALRATYRVEDPDVADHTTVEMNVSFLSPAREGERIVAEAQVLRKGRTLAVGEVEVRGPSGDLVAKGRLTYYLMRRRDGES